MTDIRDIMPLDLYENIGKYFNGVTAEDLIDLSIKDILYVIPKMYRLRFKIYYHKQLRNILDYLSNNVQPKDTHKHQHPHPIYIINENVALNYDNKLISSIYDIKLHNRSNLSFELIDDITNIIKNTNKSEIIFSNNRLVNDDLKYIKKLCDNVDIKLQINLSNNDLQENCYDSIVELLKSESVEYINICTNSVAYDYDTTIKIYENINEPWFNKLIWVEQNCIDRMGWRTIMIDDDKAINIIIKNHKLYYKIN